MNECVMTHQKKNKSDIGCQTNGIYIKCWNRICNLDVSISYHIYNKLIYSTEWQNIK